MAASFADEGDPWGGARAPDGRAAVSDDAFLGGGLRVMQPEHGYRAGLDAVLLAAATPGASGERWLDAGAGVGVAALCFAWRVAGVSIVCLDNDAAACDLARRNAGRNALSDRVTVREGDIFSPPHDLARGDFDGVLTNPPFFDDVSRMRVPAGGKRAAFVEEDGDVATWLQACLKRVRPGGRLVFIHRADRLGDALNALKGRAGDIWITPLWPMQGRPAKRILITARKGAHGDATLSAGVVLHESQSAGRAPFTPLIEAVMRRGAALPA
ncbi:MAG: methyltransferase [Pseudomonadota bacterium]